MDKVMNEKERLAVEIAHAAKRTHGYGLFNYVCAYVVAFLAVSGSVAATILAAVGYENNWVTAIVAAVPAAVLAINTTFNFERKATWHWRTTKRFEGLLRKLRYAKPEKVDVAAISKEFSDMDLETFDGWIAYSSLSGSSGPDAPKDS